MLTVLAMVLSLTWSNPVVNSRPRARVRPPPADPPLDVLAAFEVAAEDGARELVDLGVVAEAERDQLARRQFVNAMPDVFADGTRQADGLLEGDDAVLH